MATLENLPKQKQVPAELDFPTFFVLPLTHQAAFHGALRRDSTVLASKTVKRSKILMLCRFNHVFALAFEKVIASLPLRPPRQAPSLSGGGAQHAAWILFEGVRI